MEGTFNDDPFDVDTHGERERPTRAQALIQVRAITRMGALKHPEFSLTDQWIEGTRTMTVDMSRLRDTTPATVAALLWISLCAQARGVRLELHNPSPSIVERLQRAGVSSALPNATLRRRTDAQWRRNRRAHPGRLLQAAGRGNARRTRKE